MEFALKILAMGSFIGFLAVLGIYVPDFSLLWVLVLAGAMGIYDFFFYRRRNRA